MRRDTLIAEIGREVVGEMAPAELPSFAAACEVFLRHEGSATALRRRGDQVLGSGTNTVVALATPVVLVVVADVFHHLSDEVGSRAATGVLAAVTRLVRRLLRRPNRWPAPAPVDVSALTAEQLALVHQVAADSAGRLGLPAEQAALYADVVTGALAARSR